MLLHEGRSGAGVSPTLAEGWQLARLTPPSRLFGANGLRTGPDGRIYIAQVTGSQISALDVGTGRTRDRQPQGRRHHRARRCRLRRRTAICTRPR